jgi:MarR family transcriptional regulator for hemolysin
MSAGRQSKQGFRASSDPRHLMETITSRNTMRLKHVLRRYDMSPIEWRVLSHLHEWDGQNTTGLAGRTPYERSSVVRALDKLERKGLVRRASQQADRRSSIVSLTDQGRAAFERTLPAAQRLLASMLAGLAPREVETLIALLCRMRRNFGSDILGPAED